MYLHIYIPIFWFVCFFFIHVQNDMEEMTYIYTFNHSYSCCWNLFFLHFCSTESFPSIEKEEEYPIFRAPRVTVLLLGSFPLTRTMYGRKDCQTRAAIIADISTLTNIQKASSFRYILFLFSSLHEKALSNFNCSVLLPWILRRVYSAKLFSLT